MNRQIKSKGGLLISRGIEGRKLRGGALTPLSAITDAVGLVVDSSVAFLTQSQPVRYIKSQLRILGERLDVMRFQVSATAIAAVLACKLVARENIVAPLSIFICKSQPSAICTFTILIVRMLRPSRSCKPLANTHLYPLSKRAQHTLTRPRLTNTTLTHLSPGFIRMLLPLEGRDTPAPIGRILNVATLKASRSTTIAARVVNTKLINPLPRFTTCTPFEASLNIRKVLFDRQTELSSSNLQSALLTTHTKPPERMFCPLNYSIGRG